MHRRQSIRDELRATLDAHRDLGPDYEPALIESFLDKVDASARPAPPPAKPARHDYAPIFMLISSLVLAIPLTAVAGEFAGLGGILLSWAGIVAINVAYAATRR